MTEESIYELYYEVLAYNNSLLEIWITVTFATILSVYVSSPHITRFLRSLIAGLYTASSFVLLGRILASFVQITAFRDLTVASGFEPIPGTQIVGIVGPVYALLVPIGTIATLYFATTFTRQNPERMIMSAEDGDDDT